ncbi:MAG: tRNA pseudouridine(13) synthase TruD [Candidatus ainarchaeum sp.]|nr:tRNA pseudouridine(13) synthase TruD [Candidatus ainarchaeum sp.]
MIDEIPTIFITKTTALKARVKQRYSDFIVEEIYESTIEQNENLIEKKCSVQRFNIPFEQRKPFEKMIIPTNENNKEHLVLELEKINTDTNKAIAMLARGLGLSTKRIGYGGLKDKRAITCQRISVFDPPLEKIINFGAKGLELRNPVWGERIELGDLKENYFTIILRDISASEDEIKNIINDFSKQIVNGIPNFFGTQRFGGKRMITHKIGKLLIKEKYKDAIIAYLTETFEEEKEDIKSARINLAKTLDFKKALREFPSECRTELAILNHLVRKENDFMGALNALPKKTRYLFVHAYQSYIFNKIIKKRLEEFGDKALQPIGEEKTSNGIPLVILAGFETKYSPGRIGEIEKQILEEENVCFEDFKVRALSELSSKGSEKEIALFPKNFLLKRIFEDDFNEGKKAIEIEFSLSKGNYATTVLKELIKEEIF